MLKKTLISIGDVLTDVLAIHPGTFWFGDGDVLTGHHSHEGPHC